MTEKEEKKQAAEFTCSNCGSPVGIEDLVCSNCGAELSDDVQEKMDKDNIVTLRTFQNEFEAELAKAQLEDEGIECFLSSDDEGDMIPSLRMTQGVRLHVFESDVEKAKQILDSYS